MSLWYRAIEETGGAADEADEVDAKEAAPCSSNAGKSGFEAIMEKNVSTPLGRSNCGAEFGNCSKQKAALWR